MRWTRLSLGVRSELTSYYGTAPGLKLFITKHANGVLFKANALISHFRDGFE
jgi:hypothetical protein